MKAREDGVKRRRNLDLVTKRCQFQVLLNAGAVARPVEERQGDTSSGLRIIATVSVKCDGLRCSV